MNQKILTDTHTYVPIYVHDTYITTYLKVSQEIWHYGTSNGTGTRTGTGTGTANCW